MIKATWEKHFVVFTDFLQLIKVFPTNFKSAILIANIYIKVPRKFFLHYDKTQ